MDHKTSENPYDPRWLHWDTAAPSYQMLPTNVRDAVDIAVAAMLDCLRKDGLTVSVSGHVMRVVDQVAEWLLASGSFKPAEQRATVGAPDPGHAFMEWWRISDGNDPEREVIGYHGVDIPLFD
jgi:hypothetical protein